MNTPVSDDLKVLDLKRPIREADSRHLANAPKAVINATQRFPFFRLLDHLGGAGEQRERPREAERLGSPGIESSPHRCWPGADAVAREAARRNPVRVA
jgi:hypothetical protein